MNKYYLLQEWYDWGDYCSTIGLFQSWTDVLAYIVDTYADVDLAEVKIPEKTPYDSWPKSKIDLDDGITFLLIEELEV